MGAGLSMASVNKIKELANSREYSLALELVMHQDLTKSLNPQFLRLCGEIYIKNDRYKGCQTMSDHGASSGTGIEAGFVYVCGAVFADGIFPAGKDVLRYVYV